MDRKLSGAYTPKAPASKTFVPTLKFDDLGLGDHVGWLVGMSDVYHETAFKKVCPTCKGTPSGCMTCGGTGKAIEEKIRFDYEMADGRTISEAMNYKLFGGGTGKDGTPLSASTLYLRVRALTGIEDAAKMVDYRWPSGLHIPVVINVGDKQTGRGRKISSVRLRSAVEGISRASEGAPANANLFDGSEADADEEVPF